MAEEAQTREPPPQPGRDWGLLATVPAAARVRRRTRPERFWAWLLAREDDPDDWTPSYRGTVEDPQAGVRGICSSGGGIRSASFNLGALQRLEERGLLDGNSYLAAVSGGSYIAAAFSIIANRRAAGLTPAGEASVSQAPGEPELAPPPFASDSPELQYLRNRTGYMAPDGMSMVALLWRLLIGAATTFVLTAVPIAVLMGALGAWLLDGWQGLADGSADLGGAPTAAWGLPALALGLAVLAQLVHPAVRSLSWRTGLERWAARLVIAAVVLAVVLLALPALEHWFDAHKGELRSIGVGSTTLTFIAGALALLRETLSPGAPEKEGGGKLSLSPELKSRLRFALANLAGAVAGPLLLAGVGMAALYVALHPGDSEPLGFGLNPAELAVVVLAAAWLVAYYFVDLTAISLHRFYRRRLCTVFALERDEDGRARPREDAEALELSKTAFRGTGWPTLLICAAANISDVGATPRGRGVTSFTFSSAAVGGPLVGAVDTEVMEKAFDLESRKSDVSLPAAVAMSGAALSPSMGKLTRKPLRFLLALTNMRLGVWVPNPAWIDPKEGERPGVGKRPRLIYLFREMLGRNYLDSRYLYVTDGGHYENLGLVELLRRGCTEIYCFDVSAGRDADELGDAISLARSELGVEVEIDPEPIIGEKLPAAACVEGTIVYPPRGARGEVRGRLYYCRNVITADPPWDVETLAERDGSFPDDPTSEQLYAEQRFEGYRMLGYQAATAALAKAAGPPGPGPAPAPEKAPPAP